MNRIVNSFKKLYYISRIEILIKKHKKIIHEGLPENYIEQRKKMDKLYNIGEKIGNYENKIRGLD